MTDQVGPLPVDLLHQRAIVVVEYWGVGLMLGVAVTFGLLVALSLSSASSSRPSRSATTDPLQPCEEN